MAFVDKKLLRAVKRLRKDYDDILNSSTELPYVAAIPTAIIKDNESSLKDWLKWKVCIMAPPTSRFAGILLSLTLNFPENYPEKGPRAELVHGLPFRHEHVYGTWVCLSILNDFIPCWGHEIDRTEGWSYSYSVASILVQLQR
jgi:ubiquitin-protein ligase